MITSKDIAKLAEVLATKDDVKDINGRLDKLETIVSSHTTTLDGLAKDVRVIKEENLAIKRHLKLI